MKQPERKVHGMNIFLDQYGNYVYRNIFNKKVYVIRPEDEAKFLIMKDRYIFSLIIYILINGFDIPSYFSLPALLAVVAIFEVYFRLFYLKGLKSYSDHKLVKRVWYLPSKEETPKQVIVGILYVVFAGLLLLNAYLEKYGQTQIILTGLVVLLVLIRLILLIVGIIKNNK